MNEKLSYTEYLVVGSPRQYFDIGFEDYQEDKDMLKLTVDNKDVTEAGYSVVRNVGQTLEFTPAVPVGAVVRIQRVTDIDAPFYIFTAGNAFVPSNVDANFKQLLHAQQEVRDGFVKLQDDVVPLVIGLPEALEKAQEAADAAQEAAEKASEAAEQSRSASNVIDSMGITQQVFNDKMRTYTNFYVTPENYGEPADGDWSAALQWCVDTGKEVVLGDREYLTTKPIYLKNLQHRIRGVGGKKSVISKVTDTKLGLPDVVRDGKTFNIDKDAVFVCYNAGFQQLNFNNFRVQKAYRADEQYTGFGLFAPFISEFIMQDFFTWFVYYGVYTIDCWMSTWVRCHANAKAGYTFGGDIAGTSFLRGGTSLTMLSCWSTNTGENESAYRIHGFAYSNTISCGSDNVGLDGKPAFATWHFSQCPSFNMLSCGGEVIHAKHLLYAEESQVHAHSHYITHFYNKYRNDTAPYLIYAVGSAKITIHDSNIPFVYDIYSGYPNFACADYNSVLVIENCEHYPPITGNGSGNFGVYNVHGSYTKFSNRGGSFESANITANGSVSNFKATFETNVPVAVDTTAKGSFGLVGDSGKYNSTIMRIGDVRLWFNPATEQLMARNFQDPVNAGDGYSIGGCLKGASDKRPITVTIGMLYLDTTLNPNGKPIWSTGWNTWVDSSGNLV